MRAGRGVSFLYNNVAIFPLKHKKEGVFTSSKQCDAKCVKHTFNILTGRSHISYTKNKNK